MKLVFVTTQAPQLTNAGGISLPTYRLARALALKNHEVIWLVGRAENKLTPEIQKKFQLDKIKIIEVKEDRKRVSPWWLAIQLEFQKYVIDLKPDLVISQDWQAPCSLISNGIDNVAPVITWTHGGTYYETVGSSREFTDVNQVILAGLEEIQIQNSNMIVSPSQYLLNLYSSIQKLPERCFVVPLLYPEPLPFESSDELCLAYVGALSSRKGFDKFVEMVLNLKQNNLNFTVKIYGKKMDLNIPTLTKQLSEAHVRFSLEHHKSSEEIWRELSGLNTTLFVPSRLDNSPGVIYEAISANCKVLVSQTQGGNELVSYAPNHVSEIIDSDWDLLTSVVTLPKPEPADIASLNEAVVQKWLSIMDSLLIEPIPTLSPLDKQIKSDVTVVIATKNRVAYLVEALESLTFQSLLPSEVIIVDDGSDEPEKLANLVKLFQSRLRIRLIRNQNSIGQARSRNLGASLADSALLAFLDDDNRFYPNHLELCVEQINRFNLDAIASFMNQTFKNDVLRSTDKINQVAIFAGQQFNGLNSVSNLVCDTHIVVTKSMFTKVNGFPELFRSSQEDWGLGLKLLDAGAKFGSTGKPTIHYRINNDGVFAMRDNLGLANWWPLHASKFGTNSWVIPELARLGMRKNVTSVLIKRIKYLKYLKYGLNLVKSGDFMTFHSAVKRYFRS
jgi:glycosyltransferase involved in cell wall biosynthesis